MLNLPPVPLTLRLILLLLCFSSQLAVTTLAERLPIKIYTSADGLGSSAAFHLVRDARGFIWLSSRDGLVRFDGYRFITYRMGKDDADPAVFRLLPTRNGVYWINLNRGTDYRFVDQGNATVLQPIDQQLADDPRVPLFNLEPIASNFPLFEDLAGNLWTRGTKGIYLRREVDGKDVSQLFELKLPGLSEGDLTSMEFVNGSDGSFWIGTNWGLVRRLTDGRMVHYSIDPRNNSDLVRNFAEDKNGCVWIARPDGLLVLKVQPVSEIPVSNELMTRRTVVKKGQVNADGQAQLPAAPGTAFTFTFQDIFRRNVGKNPTQEKVKPAIRRILYASDGKMWFTSNGGLVKYDGKRFLHFTTEQGLPTNNLAELAEDNDGNIWVGSYAGLMRIDPKGLTAFDQRDGLADTRVHSIFASPRGELNVVTDNWNINQLRKGAFINGRPRLPDDASLFWHSNVALLDSRGDWWILSNKGLYRYSGVDRIEDLANRSPTAVYTDKNGLITNETSSVFEDSRGDLWISNDSTSKRIGLSRWRRVTNRFEHFFEEDGLPRSAYGASFTEDKAGALWVGFGNSGLARFKNEHFTSFGLQDGVPAGAITSLYTDVKGRLWIASSIGGLARVDDPTAEHPVFKHYTIADGLTSNNVRCITEDLFGNIYVGTVRGVNRLSPETGRIKYYGTADGLSADFVSAAYRDHEGVIWFGTFGGLSKLVPEADVPTPAPPVLISGLRIAGIDYSISPMGQTEVNAPEQNANSNNLQIDFFSVSPSGDTGTRYQYKLDGADQNWSIPTAQRAVVFANVRPGSYRFIVRSVSEDDIPSDSPAILTFRILPPVWQRWWFVAGAILIVGGILFALYRYRVARLREINAALREANLAEENLRKANEARLVELERVRKRIATDLHDDIGSSLTRISLLSEVAQRQGPDASTSGETSLSVIAGLSREVVDSMSDIVWAINPEKDSFGDLTQRMRRFAGDVFSARGIEFRFRLADSDRDVKVGANFRRELFLIFKEAVNNSVRHSGCTEAEIEFRLDTDRLFLKLSDNGHGFEVSDKSTGHGLASMRERTEGLGGSLEIVSRDGQGTTLSFVIPLSARDGAPVAGRAEQRNGSTA